MRIPPEVNKSLEEISVEEVRKLAQEGRKMLSQIAPDLNTFHTKLYGGVMSRADEVQRIRTIARENGVSDHQFNSYLHEVVNNDFNNLYKAENLLDKFTKMLAKGGVKKAIPGIASLSGKLATAAAYGIASETRTTVEGILGQLYGLYEPSVKGASTYWIDMNHNFNVNHLGEMAGLENLVEGLSRPDIMTRMEDATLRKLEYFAQSGGKPVQKILHTRFVDYWLGKLMPDREPATAGYHEVFKPALLPVYAGDMVPKTYK
jgi:hypothetical protein